jgi:GntR family transcriptional regulator, carbon starvation induced regulator
MSTERIDQSRLSQTEDVYERLRSAILDGQYQPEQKLKISKLSGQMQGSLGTVREALSRVLAEGLVVWEPFKGYHVAPISSSDLINVTRARIEIEKLCLASSLANGDIEWEGRLVDLLHQLSRHSPLELAADEWSRLHTAFHDALVSACDNSWLLRMHRVLHEQSERYRRVGLMFNAGPDEPMQRRTERTSDMLSEHKELADAAIARDVDRAFELIAGHLQHTTDYLLSRLQAHPALVERNKRIAASATPVMKVPPPRARVAGKPRVRGAGKSRVHVAGKSRVRVAVK